MRRVNRRRLTFALPLVATVLAAGCTTFSDDDTAARVGDVELDDDVLDELVTVVDPRYAITPEVEASLTPEELDDLRDRAASDAEARRGAISVWIDARIHVDAFAEAGITFDEQDRDANTELLATQIPTFTQLSDDTRDLLVDYVVALSRTGSLELPSDAEVARWFDAGPSSTDIACISHILVETEDEADDIVASLDDGADFAELAADRSNDPGSAAAGGDLGCFAASDVATQFVPEFASAALDALPGEHTDGIRSDFGVHVIRLGTFDERRGELAPLIETGVVQQSLARRDADVYVDARFGAFDPDLGAVLAFG